MADDGWSSVTTDNDKKRKRDDEQRRREDEQRKDRVRAETPNRARRTRNLEWFNATHTSPTSTVDEYARNHARIYGVEERMINGKHRWGTPKFPDGSARAIAHAKYSKSTDHKVKARKSYKLAISGHTADNKQLTEEESRHYKHSTGELVPTQHADLSIRALDLADASWRNGSERTDFEDSFEFPHHNLALAVEHHNNAKGGFEEYRRATNAHLRHETHRSSELDDGQRDCYGRRVTAGTRPYNRSRSHGLPPRGYYSAIATTPPDEEAVADEESDVVGPDVRTAYTPSPDDTVVGERQPAV